MKLRLLVLAPLLLLVGCSSLKKRPEGTSTERINSSYEMQIEATPPESFPETSSSKSVIKRSKGKTKAKSTQELYIGQQGYLNRPPLFTDVKYEKSFQRCSPVEITGVYQSGDKIFVYVKQNGFDYPLAGINRKDFTRNKKQRISLLDQFFVKDISWAAKGRNLASENQKVCSGQTWKNMPKKQFQFITGDPETRQQLKHQQGHYDVWTYGSPEQSGTRHYYFQSGKLYSWTQ